MFTKWRIKPFQNDIQNNSSEFNYFVHKMSHIKKEMICIWRGLYLYAATCSMTLRFLILPYFLFTRNLRIDKNYTLRFSCLVVLYSYIPIFQFNMTCIYHKTMPFISNYTHAYSFSHAFTLQIIDHFKICNSTCNKSFNSNHEIQTYILKNVFSLQISFSLIKVCYLTFSVQFTFMTDYVR